ncbi:MAGE domain-containing protein [Citrus sinensis]|nr:MAGE domain-containing protein [Citrus sinensis]
MKFPRALKSASSKTKSAGVPSEGYWDATGPPARKRPMLSSSEIDKLVAEVVRYVLFKTHQNSGCPIKREELVQLVTKNYSQRALPAHVINAAKEKLSNAFGYELRELLRCRPSSATQGRSTQQTGVAEAKSYVLISQLPAEVYKKYVEDENSAHLSGFTFVVISIVHLAGGKIPEDILWRHLKRMGLCETDVSHPVFGNAKQALEILVQQRYLQKDKINGPEGNTLFYELAERALDGPVSEKMKEYISEIVSKDVVPVDVDEAE